MFLPGASNAGAQNEAVFQVPLHEHLAARNFCLLAVNQFFDDVKDGHENHALLANWCSKGEFGGEESKLVIHQGEAMQRWEKQARQDAKHLENPFDREVVISKLREIPKKKKASEGLASFF